MNTLARAIVHQDISLQGIADYRRTLAAEAVALARSEIAARGLVVTVVQAYYHFVVAQRKYETAQRAATQGGHFLDISQKLEQGGEVAHSDVIKAQIQFQQQQRDLQESELEMNRSRLELAVLVFTDFNQNFSVVDDLQTPEPLPSLPEVQIAAARQNPELRAALSALQEARQEVGVAWSGFLPSLKLDYFYGIDANHFATRQFDPASQVSVRNLGYAATATLATAGVELGSESQQTEAGQPAARAGPGGADLHPAPVAGQAAHLVRRGPSCPRRIGFSQPVCGPGG